MSYDELVYCACDLIIMTLCDCDGLVDGRRWIRIASEVSSQISFLKSSPAQSSFC